MAKPTDRAPSHDDRPDWYPEPSAGVVHLGRRLSPGAVQFWESVQDYEGPTPVDDQTDHEALAELHHAGLVRLSRTDTGWNFESIRQFLLPVSLDDVTADGLLVFDVHRRDRSASVREWAEAVPVRAQVHPDDVTRAFAQRLAVGELRALPGDPADGVLLRSCR